MKTRYIRFIAEVLLIFSIMLAVLSIFLKYVILNETTYLNIFNESGTYDQIKDSVYKKIDNVLSSKNINFDIKESIITDEDIKRETDNAVNEILEYLKTGENNVKPPDTSIYKQRVSDILDSVIGNVIKPTSSDLSFNDNFHAKNMAFTKNNLQITDMNYIKEKSKDGQDSIKLEQLMSKSEAEARVREILKEKGLTEEEAIEKATKKGITEEQALKILASYGITIDDYNSSGNNSATVGNSTTNSSNSSKAQDNAGNITNENTKKETSSNNESKNTISTVQDNGNIKSQLNNIKNKLVEEASKSIDQEAEKINFNNVLNSSKVIILAKITSTIYKLFWVFVIMPIIIIVILIKINTKGLNSSLKYIGIAFLIVGLILTVAASSVYLIKIYENINISPVYIKDTICNMVRHILIVLLKYGVMTLVIGLFMFIPTIKKHLNE